MRLDRHSGLMLNCALSVCLRRQLAQQHQTEPQCHPQRTERSENHRRGLGQCLWPH